MGKTSLIYPKKSALYYGIKKSFSATRYHSLISDLKTLPSELIITSTLRNGSVMSIQHKTHSVFGVQFHPESIGTKIGDKIIHNFLRVKK
jgi:Anthranilate/para-aminobenzoate synthases component II